MPLPNLAIAPFYPYEQDTLFDPKSSLNRDDCLAFFRLLRARLEAAGAWCHTIDVCRDRGLVPDVVLFFEIPHAPVASLLAGWDPRPEAWVVLQECEVTLPHNWVRTRHLEFTRVFTWADPLVDGVRYRKLNFPNALHVPAPLDVETADRNLVTMVAGHKEAAHPLELYSARRAVIRWFEAHQPEAFDLYGVGWERGAADGPFPSYAGPVDRKLEALDRYWFTVCFENARHIDGYITEKLFDCLLARTVPVYWGPDNIGEHVPADTFIDMRSFGSVDELHAFLVAMEPDAYEGYLAAARRFLGGPQARPFSNEGWTDVVVGALEDRS